MGHAAGLRAGTRYGQSIHPKEQGARETEWGEGWGNYDGWAAEQKGKWGTVENMEADTMEQPSLAISRRRV